MLVAYGDVHSRVLKASENLDGSFTAINTLLKDKKDDIFKAETEGEGKDFGKGPIDVSCLW